MNYLLCFYKTAVAKIHYTHNMLYVTHKHYEAQILLGLGVSCVGYILCPTRHQWLHWIMPFSQIIIGVDVSVSCPCLSQSMCFIAKTSSPHVWN